jgi:hypothetical protein
VIKHGRAEFQETIRKQQYTNANERIDKITKRIKNITGNITTERESIELLDITNNAETSVKEINTEFSIFFCYTFICFC